MLRLKSHWKEVIAVVLLGGVLVGWLAISDATVVIEVYRVKPGDTLERIANRYGVSIDLLRQKNGFAPGRRLKAGDMVVVPVSDKAKPGNGGDTPQASNGNGTQTPSAPAGNTQEGRKAAGHLLVSEVYYVKAGETVESIARKFDVPTETLQHKNGLQPDASLQAGQILIVPVRESVLYESEPSPGAGQDAPPERKPGKASDGKVVGQLGVISAGGARIRKSAGPTGRTVYTCSKGTQLVIVNEKDDWYGVMMIDGSTCWVPEKYVQPLGVELLAGKADPGTPGYGNWDVVREAYRYLGIPYVYGGSSLGGMDCSAFVRRVFASRGYSLPRTAASQFNVGAAVGYEQLEPGDRLYFSSNGYRVNHTGIYIGNGQMIHASGRAGCVTVDSLFSPRHWSGFVGARR